LINRARAGDKEALIKLVMERKQEYYKLAYVFTENREDSLDALQDMIVILFGNIKKLKKQEAFYSWSKTILVNCCRAIIKRRKKVVLTDEYAEEVYHESYSNGELKQDILQGLRKLNEGQQVAIKLKYFMDMDYETIANMTKVPVGTVKSRIFTGLARLKEVFGGERL
jgi:RNA polymerase sigma-70 factor (ECF subfamily)